uniref:Ge1_WD40 domain-containing protein n=1 Tax=Anopheles maculatus TaxID=74869 RepID=A0A182SXJ5_9DIPT
STDGLIRFYQVYQHANDRSPRRLHLWKPHDGKPITSFFFLDNYTETVNNKTIWKHAITCAENNAEIKVWCCESWECLQTVRLTSPLTDATLHFKAEIDISSTYLVLTERTTRQIYVLQIRKGKGSGSPDADAEVQSKKTILTKESTAHSTVQPYIVSIAEYPLSASVLGFAILYASSGNSKYGEYDDEDDEEQSSPQCVVIRMFLVQPNNLQDCTLMYEAIAEEESDLLLSNDLGNAADRDVTESHENSSSVTSSASSETTDNNVSHPPSEEDDELAAQRKATKGTVVDAENGANAHDDGSDNPDTEADKPVTDKMAEAAQKLNDVFEAIRTGKTSTEGTNVGASAPTTPASNSTKVNLMAPDSFSSPVGSSASR